MGIRLKPSVRPAYLAVIGGAVAVMALLLTFAPPAGAYVTPAGSGEPAFTKGTSNTWWFSWSRDATANEYVCYTLYVNGVSQGYEGLGCTSPLSGSSQTLKYSKSSLISGDSYGICASEYADFGAGYVPYNNGSECSTTTMDNSAPSASTSVDGTSTYTNSSNMALTIYYSDSISYPWPGGSTFDCWRKNANTTSTGCQNASGGADTFQFDSGCSSPNSNTSRSSNWQCTYDISPLLGFSDGKWYYCVREADDALPDNSASSNQFTATSNQANLSPDTPANCGYITLDRTPPSVTPSTGSTTVNVGQLVSFKATSSDATSGPSGSYDWDFGDNTPHGSGSSPTHTYTQPGTYVVTVKTQDNAGNTGTGTLTMHVLSASGGGTTGGNTGGSTGGSTGSGGSGASTGSGTSGGSTGSGGTGGTGGNAAGTPHSCVVPALKGKSKSAARSALQRAGCSLGKVTAPKHSPRHRPGKHHKWALVVTGQSPAAHRSLGLGARVNVTLGYVLERA